MNKCIKLISHVLVLALLLSMAAGLTVLAEGEEPGQSPVSVGDPAPVADPTPAPELSIDSYQVLGEGTASGTAEPITTVSTNQSGLSIRVYFSDGDGTTVTGTIDNSDFVLQGGEIKQDSVNPNVVVFSGLKYQGPGRTFSITLTQSGKSKSHTFEITECAEFPQPTPVPTPEPPLPTPEPTPTPAPKTPGLIIKETSFGGSSVPAGEPFNLTLTLYATDGGENLTDVMVTLGITDKDITLASGNLNVYLGEMAPNSTRKVTYQVLPSASFVGGVATFSVSLSGKGKSTGAAPTTDGSTSVSVPVSQPDRFEITNLEAAETMMMGEEGYVSLTFVNKGKMDVSNLSAEIKGDNLANPGQSQYLGNLTAGSENSVDFTIQANSAGPLEATIVLTYEDPQGNVKTLEKTFTCNVEESMIPDDPFIDPSNPGGLPTGGDDIPEAGMPIWGWLLIVVGVAAAAVVVVVVVKKKKKAKQLADLGDSDEDI